MKISDKLTAHFLKIRSEAKKAEAQISKLTAQRDALLKAGTRYNCTPNMRAGKYLRLLYGGTPRRVEYIGCEKDKIKAALQSIERGKKARELSHQIGRRVSALEYLELTMRNELDDFKAGQKRL